MQATILHHDFADYVPVQYPQTKFCVPSRMISAQSSTYHGIPWHANPSHIVPSHTISSHVSLSYLSLSPFCFLIVKYRSYTRLSHGDLSKGTPLQNACWRPLFGRALLVRDASWDVLHHDIRQERMGSFLYLSMSKYCLSLYAGARVQVWAPRGAEAFMRPAMPLPHDFSDLP